MAACVTVGGNEKMTSEISARERQPCAKKNGKPIQLQGIILGTEPTGCRKTMSLCSSIHTMSPSSTQILSLADRFLGAIQTGDENQVRSCYSPNAGIWHNNDLVVQTVDQNLVTLGGLIKGSKTINYKDRKVQVTVDARGRNVGFVQQHVLEATGHDGRKMELHAVIICTVDEKGEKITRLDEYFDQKVVDKWVAEGRKAKKAKI